MHLLDEFGSELVISHLLQRLQLLLLFNGSHEREAVAIGEDLLYEASDPVLVLYGVAESLLLMQGLL